MRHIQIAIAFVLPFLATTAACTPAAQQTATTVASVVEVGCLALVSVEAPNLEPLCVQGDELAQAIIDYIAAHAGNAPSVTTDAQGHTVVSADLYAGLVAKPAVKGRRAAPKCAGGRVAP